ncbi:MAG: ATP-binding protein [Pseudomonadota bacterium]
MPPVFPFSAIVGQPALKLALTLSAIDPRIGGVLLSGARGTAKSTIARALVELLPGDGRLVTLPLGASEDRITGSLDIEKVLDAGSVRFAPGLLQDAHQGVLYVDEVNLLPDHLVDLLLDVAASGVNTVERDGVSHSHPSEFILIGTMNPEEGELRPQLLDRYGLCVEVSDGYSVDERIEIVRTRLAFDTDADAFVADSSPAQTILIDQCTRARAQLANIKISAEIELAIAERCLAENVEGVRADLVMRRAAVAHAALGNRADVTQQDIDAVAEFALAHRRRVPPEAPPQSGASEPPPPHSKDKSAAHSDGDWGALPPVNLAAGETRKVDFGDATDKKKVT